MALPTVLPDYAGASVALEPVHNALNSLALLNSVERRPALPAWVVEMAAALSPEQRHANRLVVQGLHAAFMAGDAWPDFSAYLAALAAQGPRTLRDQMLERICRPSPVQAGSEATMAPPAPVVLLADREAYVAWSRAIAPEEPGDAAIYAEAHALLGDPPALHDLVVSHLRAMWDEVLAPEWSRALPALQREASALQGRLDDDPRVAENVRKFVVRALEAEPIAASRAVEEIVCVPSPHTGRYVIPRQSGSTLRIFFDASRNAAVLMRTSSIEKAELLLRLAALADDTRLRILEMFAARDELSAPEIMARLDLSQSSVSRHLKQLFAYVVESRAGGANKRYRLSPAQFDLTFHAVKQLLTSEGASIEQPDERAGQPGDLRRFMDRQGRITFFPVKLKDQLLILEYIAARFEPGRFYSEKEVNALISQQITFQDYVTLRRSLCDFQFLDRVRDGSRYWRARLEEAGERE